MVYGIIGDQANFQTLYIAITTLWRAATGEEWNLIMRETMAENGFSASFFWVLFDFINEYIFLKIVIAVIFEKLEERAR